MNVSFQSRSIYTQLIKFTPNFKLICIECPLLFLQIVVMFNFVQILGVYDSIVGVAAHYGLDGSGIESWQRASFSAPVQTGHVVQPASYKMGIGFLSGEQSGRRVALTTYIHLAPRLRKGQSYTSPPHLSLRVLFQGEIYLYQVLIR